MADANTTTGNDTPQDSSPTRPGDRPQSLSPSGIRDRYESEYRKNTADRFRSERQRGQRVAEEAELKLKGYQNAESTPEKRALWDERIEEAQKEAQVDKKNLFEKVREANQQSRGAIAKTSELMQSGDLRIAHLATQNQALVVHAIPPQGFSMKNTSGNNQEIDAVATDTPTKLFTIKEKQPDLSASIISTGGGTPQQLMYPLGVILDGTLVAAYKDDASTITKGDARYIKYQYKPTLQTDPVAAFREAAASPPSQAIDGWNESIVHKPEIRAFLIDETKLAPIKGYDYYADEVREDYPQEQEEEILKRYPHPEAIKSTSRGTPKSGSRAGIPTFRIMRRRSGIERVHDYVDSINTDKLPVYIRRADGIYDRQGTKVTPNVIYGVSDTTPKIQYVTPVRGASTPKIEPEEASRDRKEPSTAKVQSNINDTSGLDQNDQITDDPRLVGPELGLSGKATDFEAGNAANASTYGGVGRGLKKRARKMIGDQLSAEKKALFNRLLEAGMSEELAFVQQQLQTLSDIGAREASKQLLKNVAQRLVLLEISPWLFGIALTICAFQFVFAVLSVIGIGLWATINNLVTENIIGKTVQFVVGLFGTKVENLLPIDTFALTLWAIATFIGLMGFIGFMLFFRFMQIDLLKSTLTSLILFFCLALTITPIANIFPWLFLWVFNTVRSEISIFGMALEHHKTNKSADTV